MPLDDTANQAFDLSAFETADTGSFTLLNAKGDELLVNGNPVIVTVHGHGSKPAVAAGRKQQKAAKAALMASMQGRGSKQAEDDEFRRDAEYLAACTISITNFPVPPVEIYLNPKLAYITRQVAKFLADEGNFTNSSPQS